MYNLLLLSYQKTLFSTILVPYQDNLDNLLIGPNIFF